MDDNISPQNPESNNNLGSIKERIGEYLFDHYMAVAIIISILLLIMVMITIPSTIPYIIQFLVINLPKGLIFAAVLQIFVNSIYSNDTKSPWFKAICFGIVYSFVTLGGSFFGRYNWVSMGLILLVIMPLMLFYDLEFKKTLPIIILSFIFGIVYDATLFATIMQLVT